MHHSASMENVPPEIKTLRRMKPGRTPSERLSRKISDTYDYFLQKVDPVIGACVTQLLNDQPTDVAGSMINYLKAIEAKTEVPSHRSESSSRREPKIFLATRIAPVLAGLVNRVASERPENVISFMTSELERHIADPEYFNQFSKSKAPTTSKGKLMSPAKAKKAAHSEHTTTANGAQQEQLAEVVEKSIQIAVVGLGGSGKSSVLNMMQGKFESKIKPTVGFRPVSMMLSETATVRFYDLGGGKKIRDIWKQYYHDAHGLIFVVDGAAPAEEMEATAKTFADTLANPFVAGKPLLVLVNKQDDPAALSAHDVDELLRPHVPTDTRHAHFSGCSAYVPEAVPDDFTADPRIEASLMHLLTTVLDDFQDLNERVRMDTLRKTADEAAQRIAKERKVLKNKIACAFLSAVDPAFVAAMQIEAEPENIFSPADGIEYLASEVGEEVTALSDEAVAVAGLVGYHKLALTIVGGLKAPVSKKKVPMEWSELKELVVTLREELGLGSAAQ